MSSCSAPPWSFSVHRINELVTYYIVFQWNHFCWRYTVLVIIVQICSISCQIIYYLQIVLCHGGIVMKVLLQQPIFISDWPYLIWNRIFHIHTYCTKRLISLSPFHWRWEFTARISALFWWSKYLLFTCRTAPVQTVNSQVLSQCNSLKGLKLAFIAQPWQRLKNVRDTKSCFWVDVTILKLHVNSL